CAAATRRATGTSAAIGPARLDRIGRHGDCAARAPAAARILRVGLEALALGSRSPRARGRRAGGHVDHLVLLDVADVLRDVDVRRAARAVAVAVRARTRGRSDGAPTPVLAVL